MQSPHVAVPASAFNDKMTPTTLAPSYQDGLRTNGITNGVAKSGNGSGGFETTTAPAAVPLLNNPTTTSATLPAPRALPEICFTLRRKLLGLLEEQTDDSVLRGVQEQVRISMGVIEKAICMYRPEELSIAYNGGKDCLVLLILLLACLPISGSTTVKSTQEQGLPELSPQKQPPPPTSKSPNSAPPKTLQAIYIAPPDPFPEVEDFVTTSTIEYDLDLTRYALPMRPALEAYLSERPTVKAVFMGTRRTDPHSEFLEHFSPTDKGWPQFMRVNPVIDWHYTEIWTFIRHLQIPFCCLYDRGYSSLGGVSNTRPNPALKIEGDGFRPAYELVRDEQERLGRDK
ncbi:hypothetical protein V8F20_005779 [Naviculisporaceae sp. PSN 640]